MNEIGPKRFRLIFRGELEPGTDADQARTLFGRRFGVTGSKLETCFSGRKVAVRSHLSESGAFRLQAELQAEGLVTRIEAMAAPTNRADRGENPPSAPRPAPAPAAQTTTGEQARPAPSGAHCTACGQPVNNKALHCPRCGTRQHRRGGVWPLIAGLALLTLAAIPVVVLLVLPQLEDNRTGKKVEQALSQGEETAARVKAFMKRTNFRPNSNLDAGLPPPEELARPPLASVRVSRGALITLTFESGPGELAGKTILFKPETDDQGLPSWRCHAGSLAPARLPPRCQTEAAGAESTDTTKAKTPVNGAGQDGVAQRVISEAMEGTGDIRRSMEQFRATEGRWPANNSELGLESPRRLATYSVRSIRVEPDGELTLQFVSSVAGDGENRLTLYHRNGKWQCRSEMAGGKLPEKCRRDPEGSR